LASGLAILKRLDAEGKLTADQKEWITDFEDVLYVACAMLKNRTLFNPGLESQKCA